MTVATLNARAAVQIDAQGCAEQVGLDVVYGERVSRQQGLHVAGADQRLEVSTAAGVDHHGAGDDRDAVAPGTDAPHFQGQFIDLAFDTALGRDLRRHEGELAPAPARIGNVHAHTRLPADDCLARVEIPHQLASGRRRIAGVVHDDGRVHALATDPYPTCSHADVRGIDRGAAEVLRRNAILLHDHQRGDVAFFGDPCAEGPQPFDGLVESRLAGRADHESNATGLIASFAGAQPLQPKAAAGAVHGVEGMGHHPFVKQVALHFHTRGADWRLHRRSAFEAIGQILVEHERQALGRAARLDEFGQRRGDDFEVPCRKRPSEFVGGMAGE